MPRPAIIRRQAGRLLRRLDSEDKAGKSLQIVSKPAPDIEIHLNVVS